MARIVFVGELNKPWYSAICEQDIHDINIDFIKEASDLIYFFDMTDEEYDLLLTPDEYVKYSEAMDDYARHAPTGIWHCLPEELNEPCPLDTHCPVHDD